MYLVVTGPLGPNFW